MHEREIMRECEISDFFTGGVVTYVLYIPTIFSCMVWALEYGLKPFLQPLPDDITCRACINAETV